LARAPGRAIFASDQAAKSAVHERKGELHMAFGMTFGFARGALVAAASLAAMTLAQAQTPAFKPAIVYDMGGKFDKSFNEGVYNGAEAFKKATGTEYRDFEVTNDSQREQALRRFARDGFSPVVAVGFSQASSVEKVAAEFPKTQFTIIDMVVDKPNVQSLVFKEHEGSFVVGAMAAAASKTGKVGFVGGMDIPLIRKFACGYVQGVKSVKPDAEIFQNMTGTTGAAWNDPVKGAELAKSQMDRGADVIYHAAGGTGIGVLRAAAEAGKLGIGVDSNQNALHPGKILTSMLKRVDVATQATFKAAKEGSWKPGVTVLGLKEEGVGYAMDDNNKPIVTEAIKAAADKAVEGIKAGTISVHDYMSDSKCPM
jgi:basic membrane protein A